MNREQLYEILRLDPKHIADNEKFWALYAVTFYERFFGNMSDPNEIEAAFKEKAETIHASDIPLHHKKEALEALMFFKMLRLDELENPDFWEQTSKRTMAENMKAKLVKESLSEYFDPESDELSKAKMDFRKLADELEKRRIPCKIQLVEFGQKYNIDVYCGMDYPDSLFDKVYDAMDDTDVKGEISADGAGGVVLDSRRIAGGPKRYGRF